jgi:hypothetical protein
MKTTPLALVGLALVLLAAGCKKSPADLAPKEPPITGHPNDPPVALKAEWKPGNRFSVHVETSQSAQMNFGRQPTVQENLTVQDYLLTVTNADEGRRGLEMEMQTLMIQARMGEQDVIQFDSLNKAAPNTGLGVTLLPKLIGGRIFFLVDSNNSVLKVEGIQELFDRAQGGEATGLAARRQEWTSGVLGRIYNADYFKQMVDVGSLPAGVVRIGDHWTREQEIDVGLVGRVVATLTNTLRGWQQHDGRKCARIEINGSLAMKNERSAVLLALFDAKLQDGRVSGKSWFDPVAGLPRETVLEQSCNIVGTLPNFLGFGGRGGRGPQATNSGPQKVSSPWQQTASIKITEPEPAGPAK